MIYGWVQLRNSFFFFFVVNLPFLYPLIKKTTCKIINPISVLDLNDIVLRNTHFLLPCYLSFKLGHPEQKNNIIIETVETPLSCGFALIKHRYARKISLYSTKFRVIICQCWPNILARQSRMLKQTIVGWLSPGSTSFHFGVTTSPR